MKYETTSLPFAPNFENWPVGSTERLVHGYWQLGMMRLHTLSMNCSKDFQDRYNRINHKLGTDTAYIDLLKLDEDQYTTHLLNIIQNDKRPAWIWFINCGALLNTSIAGWLRSILTTGNVEHIRVTFLLDSQDQYNLIFQDYSAPLYKSTTKLMTN